MQPGDGVGFSARTLLFWPVDSSMRFGIDLWVSRHRQGARYGRCNAPSMRACRRRCSTVLAAMTRIAGLHSLSASFASCSREGRPTRRARFAERLAVATEAGLQIERFERVDVHKLINAIDAVQAGRNYLARQQLGEMADSDHKTIAWAAEMWNSRCLLRAGRQVGAVTAAERSISIAGGNGS